MNLHPPNVLSRRIQICSIFLLAIFSAAGVLANEPAGQLKTSIDATDITVGDIITVSLSVQVPPTTKVAFPSAGNTIGEWVVRSASSSPAKTAGNGSQELGWQVQLTIYKTGEFDIPSMEVETIKTNGERTVLASSPMKVKVSSVLTAQDQGLKDIKAQARIAGNYRSLLFFLTALAAAGLLLYRLVRFLRKRRSTSEVVIPDPRTPEQFARDAIQALLQRKLVEKGLLKEFYLELSEIVKRYLGQKLNILSLERTTEEFAGDLRETPLPLTIYQMIHAFLGECDLVKFAKYHPSPEEIEKVLQQAFRVIESTEAFHIPSRREIEVSP
ncbi:MAG: hypothetical protein U0V70_13275 [Terriglobia bacterium]